MRGGMRLGFMLVWVLVTAVVQGQDTVTIGVIKPERVRLNKAYLKSYYSDGRGVLLAPLNWEKKEWITFGAFAATSLALYQADHEIYQFIHRNKSITGDWVSSNLLEPIGRGVYTLPLLGLFYAIGAGADSERAENIALTGIKAMIISQVYVQVAKNLFHRQRPYQNKPVNARLWDGPFVWKKKHTSFPSGHSVSAWSVATVFALAYNEKKGVGMISYGLASLTALSRINDNKHWASDVFVGSAVGYFIGRQIYRQNKSKLQFIPYAPGASSGITMIYPIP